MNPGIYNIPDSEYHAAPAVGNSDLRSINRSPAHYAASKAAAREETPAKLQGHALHCAILEPDSFDLRFIGVPDDAPRRPSILQRNAKKPSPETVESIKYWDAFNALAEGKEILPQSMFGPIQEAAAAIRAHPELAGFLKVGHAELSVFANDPVTGAAVKCRPDWLCTVGGHLVCIDLKSTEDARPVAFERSAYSYGYFQQAAFYPDVMSWCPKFAEVFGKSRPDLWLFAAFEKDAPYAVKLYEVGDEAQERGRQQYRRALDLYAHCVATGEFPAYDTTIEPLHFPAWAKE